MAIGLGVVLIVIGAILAFAVHASVSGVDLVMIGWILMGAGVLVLIIGAAILLPRSRRMRSSAITTDSLGRQAVTERDDRISGL